MKRTTIKTLLKTTSVCVFSFSIAMQVFANNSLSEKEGPIINPLINALRLTNNPVSNKVAETLLSLKNSESSYDLHLRNADLNYNQIKSIAEAIKTVHENGGPSLQSFSMSYNSNLGDEGVLILVKNLPQTITEIGLVNCGIGDKGGEALIRWSTNAKQLRWLCVEENIFSNDIKDRLRKLGQESSDLLVVY
jgi:single-stranded DNA-specific DHH superfamily exonuclease